MLWVAFGNVMRPAVYTLSGCSGSVLRVGMVYPLHVSKIVLRCSSNAPTYVTSPLTLICNCVRVTQLEQAEQWAVEGMLNWPSLASNVCTSDTGVYLKNVIGWRSRDYGLYTKSTEAALFKAGVLLLNDSNAPTPYPITLSYHNIGGWLRVRLCQCSVGMLKCNTWR